MTLDERANRWPAEGSDPIDRLLALHTRGRWDRAISAKAKSACRPVIRIDQSAPAQVVQHGAPIAVAKAVGDEAVLLEQQGHRAIDRAVARPGILARRPLA